MGEAIIPQLIGAAASTVMGSLFSGSSGGQATPAPPPPSAPTVMPTADAQAVQTAQRNSIAAQVARRGRASTILTDQSATPQQTLGA